MPLLPIQSSLVVVVARGHLLTVRGGKRPHLFCLPGGMMQPGELPIGAAMRELREETGIEAALEATPLMIESPGDGPWRTACYLALQVRGKLAPANEILEIAWKMPDELTVREHPFSSFYRHLFALDRLAPLFARRDASQPRPPSVLAASTGTGAGAGQEG